MTTRAPPHPDPESSAHHHKENTMAKQKHDIGYRKRMRREREKARLTEQDRRGGRR